MVKKKEKNTGKRVLKGCLSVILIFMFIGIVGGILMWQGYKAAELKDAEKKITQIEKTLKEEYPQYANKVTTELAIKFYLLLECEGGQERIDLLWNIDQNVTASACTSLLRKNINFKDLEKIPNDLDLLDKIKNLNFGDAIDEYEDFINKQDIQGQLLQDYYTER